MTNEPATGPGKIANLVSAGQMELDDDREAAWLEVIQKVDEVYSDLIRYEADLERKNSELEEAQAFISSVIASVSDILIVCDDGARDSAGQSCLSASDRQGRRRGSSKAISPIFSWKTTAARPRAPCCRARKARSANANCASRRRPARRI